MTSRRVSPLLRSAMEVLEHGLWHFFRSSTAVDMKFAIMHIDQAIELVLKERVRIGSKSIYKPGGRETISIWGAYDKLDELGCDVPERPDLEILHEERNHIQHRHSNPDPEDAEFLVDQAMAFLARFLVDELDYDLADFIPLDFLEEFEPS